MANVLQIKKEFESFRTEFNLDDSAKRLDLEFFYDIDWQLLRQKMQESKTCLMRKRSSAYIIKNYVRIINDEMKDFPGKQKINNLHFANERKYTAEDIVIPDIMSIEF